MRPCFRPPIILIQKKNGISKYFLCFEGRMGYQALHQKIRIICITIVPAPVYSEEVFQVNAFGPPFGGSKGLPEFDGSIQVLRSRYR
jgi:hypothetical protein